MQNLFKQAAKKYNAGDFHGAHDLYQQAGDKFGMEMVRHNIFLCEQQLEPTSNRLSDKYGAASLTDTVVDSFFDKVFVVNLDKDLAKRFKITKQLRECGVDFELFTATDGTVGEVMQEFMQYQARPQGALKRFAKFNHVERQRSSKFIESPGAWGYIKTYLRLLEYLKAQGIKRVLILEDDVILADNFFPKLTRLMANVTSNWKLIHLGASQYNWDKIDGEQASRDGFYHPTLLDTCGSFAMALDVSIADKLIELASSFEAPFDHLPLGHIYNAFPDKCFVAFPNIVMPDVSASSIRQERCQSEHSQKMKWPLADFCYPLSSPSLALIVEDYDSLRYWSSFAGKTLEAIDLRLFANFREGLVALHSMDVADKYQKQFQPIKSSIYLSGSDVYGVIKSGHILTELDLINFVNNSLSANCSAYTQIQSVDIIDNKIVDNRVSVIVPTYGRSNSLENALESVATQSYSDKEIIVVDDNGISSDAQLATAKIVQNIKFKYPKLNIKYLIHESNRNGSAARNTGYLASKGEYICFLDDDDIYLPGRLSKSIAKLKQTNSLVGAVYCGYINGGETGRDKTRYICGDLSKDILLLDYQKHYVHTNTVTYKRKAVEQLNGFDESYIRHQDLEFNLRFFNRFSVDVVCEPLVHLRPFHVTHENKVFNQQMRAVKYKLLSQFEPQIKSFSEKIQNKIYLNHWKELIEFSSSKKELKRRLKNNNNQFNINLFK
ncbi:glycosyltransferase [Thalassotalea sp. HSM 43]|uniref:glycosyltransferase n=1 Tax=Thalassotalea sp. HSM 43 TaxID=2552945 RepID=UPI0010809009|nr:glycosyltransferase [Thalassotalea sp. HSM 43]QBY03538.1 glycosyltransferase [Thalassotalea sp. HSM 43]